MFSGFKESGLRSNNGSALRPEQMLEEAMDYINQSFAQLNEKNALDRLAGLTTRRECPSFDFRGSDGHLLRVQTLSPGQPEPLGENGNSEPQTFTILDRANHINGYPCVRTNEGDLVFVFDPTATSAERLCQGHGNSESPQLLTQGLNRTIKKHVPEHVPRPMNAFIIYRNAEMKAVREKYPGIGNNDVSRIVGQRWRELDPKIREHYKELAANSAREHQVKHPGYKYTPRKPEDVVRRRKRTVTVGEHIRNPSIHRSNTEIIPHHSITPYSILTPPHNHSIAPYSILTPPHPIVSHTPVVTPHPVAPNCPTTGLLNLDDLTNIWVQEPTAQNFDALMKGFDHALGVATENTLENAKYRITIADDTKVDETKTDDTTTIYKGRSI
uniref:MAT1-2-1 protein n=5 Tax=Morchella TaxID=5193 RepID=A0A7T7FRI5_9PEZI|nr:MAT1-2-1 protein [Morchella sp. Mes-6]